MSDELPPLHQLTPDDRGSIVIIVSYFLVSVTVVLFYIRYSLSTIHKLPYKLDDFGIIISTVLSTITSIFFHLAVNNGLGRHIADLGADEVERYFKFMYVGQILGILAMSTAKISVVFFFYRLIERKPRRFRITLSFILIWTLFSLIAILFQCQLPHPYVLIPSQCFTHGAIYYPIIILNILTDADLASWILPTLWNVQMPLGQRLLALILFGARILVCFAAIVQLVFVAKALESPDQTWVNFDRAICDLSVIHLSVLCAILPRTNKLLSKLQSSNITVGINDFELSQARLRTGAVPNSVAQPDTKAETTPTKDLKVYSTMWV